MNKTELFDLYLEIQEQKKEGLIINNDLQYIINLVERNYYRHFKQHLKLKNKILDKDNGRN